MATMTDRDLVEATIHDLEEVLNRLVGERDQLQERLDNLSQRIAYWKKRLAALSNGEVGLPPQTRAHKGENLAAVRTVLEAKEGLTIRDVADRAMIAWSSARNVLRKYTEIFEERERLWYFKAVSPLETGQPVS